VLTLVVALTSVVVVRADVPVPPPKGEKFVGVKHSIKLDKGITDVQFFTRPLGLRNGDFVKIELSTEKAVELKGYGKFGLQLVAVPAEVAKNYSSEKELFTALNGKLDGVSSATFSPRATLPEKDERSELSIEHTITGFDKKAIQMKDSSEAPAKKEKGESSFAPPPLGSMMSGLALAAAFATGGLWLVRRRSGPSQHSEPGV
jgi:hypothetical protein